MIDRIERWLEDHAFTVIVAWVCAMLFLSLWFGPEDRW